MRIVPRSEWGATRPRAISSAPVQRQGLVVHHAATTAWTDSLAPKRVQNIHLRKGWADVGYNFLVDLNGTIYEGRALDVQGAHTKGANRTHHAVCMIGSFVSRRPPDAMVDAIRWLHEHGQQRGWW